MAHQFLIQLGADKDQVYTLTATASDQAGNTITQQATISFRQGKCGHFACEWFIGIQAVNTCSE